MNKLFWPLLAALMWTVPVQASENGLDFDLYSLSADAEAEIDNDLWLIELNAQAEGNEATTVANEVNAAMGWATQQLKAWPAVRARTTHYRTWPRHGRGTDKIVGWGASQGLRLEIEDAELASTVVQQLQERLQVVSMQASVKTSTRRDATDELIADALDAYRKRAQRIAASMGSNSYRVVEVHVNTGMLGPQLERGMMMRASADAAVHSAPAMEPGNSRITVNVSGRIQLN